MRNGLRNRCIIASLLASIGLCVSSLQAQFVTPIPRADKVNATAAQPSNGGGVEFASGNEPTSQGDEQKPARVMGWEVFRSADAELYWQQDKVEFLKLANIGWWGDRGTLYTELASVLSGAWRIGGGVVVSTGTQSEDDNAESESDPGDENKAALSDFVSGGGNLTFTANRPIAVLKRDHVSGSIMFAPRVWLDLPEFSEDRSVSNYGGDLGLQMIFVRSDNNQNPFLFAQVRAAPAWGSNDFLSGLGLEEDKPFVHGTIALGISLGGVVFGVQRFVGPDAFDEQSKLRLSISLSDNTKK